MGALSFGVLGGAPRPCARRMDGRNSNRTAAAICAALRTGKGNGTQEAQEAQERERNLVPLVLLVFRSLSPFAASCGNGFLPRVFPPSGPNAQIFDGFFIQAGAFVRIP